MKKTIKLFAFFLVTLFAIFTLTGCNNNSNHEIVGNWNWEDTGTLFYSFNADGTGWMFPGVEINWRTGGGVVTITVDGSQIAWEYLISGNRLMLTNPDFPELLFHYLRQ